MSVDPEDEYTQASLVAFTLDEEGAWAEVHYPGGEVLEARFSLSSELVETLASMAASAIANELGRLGGLPQQEQPRPLVLTWDPRAGIEE